jgi:hypothetical protein
MGILRKPGSKGKYSQFDFALALVLTGEKTCRKIIDRFDKESRFKLSANFWSEIEPQG